MYCPCYIYTVDLIFSSFVHVPSLNFEQDLKCDLLTDIVLLGLKNMLYFEVESLVNIGKGAC